MAKPDHLLPIHSTKNQFEEGKRVVSQRDVPFRDVLHAILARDHEAQLISRDVHFERLKEITLAKKPEDFL